MSSFGTMTSALFYLRATSIVGRVKSRLKRLKQPKYLAGALVGAAYLYFVFFRRMQAPNRGAHTGPGGRTPPELPTEFYTLFAEVGALVLFVVLLVNWLSPRQAALAFSESEIAFLFPAPVNRRMLVHYRILGSQLGIIFTALIFTVAFGRGQGLGGNPWFHAIGWWLILAMLNLHFTATSFVYSRVLNRSITPVRKRALIIGTGIVVALALLTWIVLSIRLPTPVDVRSGTTIASYLAQQLHSGPLPWLLALPKMVIAPYFSTNVRDFLLAMAPALVLLAVHYFWVVHTEVSFEEASIARAERRAARRRAVQQGDWRGESAARKARAPAFKLQSAGRPEIAFLWKNLLATSSFYRPRPLLVLTAVIIAGASWMAKQPYLIPVRAGLTFAIVTVLGMMLFFGPQVARQDLRSDLVNTDILKTYPLRGWQVVLGELLTPIVVLSVLFWIGLLSLFLLLPVGQWTWITPSLRGEAALGLALLAPPFIAIQLLMPNAAAVLFPAWVQSTRDRTERGIEVLGQRLIFMAGQLLITALVIVPAFIAGALVFLIAQALAGFAVGAAIAVIGMALLLAFEAWIGIRWLGNRFEAFDLSAELRP
jgi:putative ABC exporter